MDYTDNLPQVGFGDLSIGDLHGVLFGGVGSAFTAEQRGFYPGGFVPLQTGLNCVYGLNGSGKTRFLEALGSVLDNLQGHTEGLVFADCCFVSEFVADSDGESVLCSLSDSDALFRDIGVGQGWRAPRDLGASLGHSSDVEVLPFRFQSLQLDGLAGELLREALQTPQLLFTRQLNGYRPDDLVVVPMIAGGDRGHKARVHVAELRDSLAAVVRELAERLTEAEGDSWHEVCRDRQIAWLDENRGSPFLNARTVDFTALGPDWLDDDHAPHPVPFLVDDEAPILLPPIAAVVGGPIHEAFLDEDTVAQRDEAAWQNGHLRCYGDQLGDPPSLTFRESEDRWDQQGDGDDLTRAVMLDTDPSRRAALATHLGQTATELFSRLLPGSGQITLDVGSADDWLKGSHPVWLRDGEGLEVGSNAQRRWALFSVAMALAPATRFVLIDEPEAGLHRTAEKAIAHELADGDLLRGRVIVTATHCPAFLDASTGSLLHARAYQAVEPMGLEPKRDLATMGLTPSDALALTRTFLIVEGAHDELVLTGLLGPELAELGVTILKMSGARSLEQVGASDFLYEFTDAPLAILLDHLEGSALTRTWNQARNYAQRGRVDLARKVVLTKLGKSSAERRALANFLLRCVTDGNHERVHILGLCEPDIIHYLPSTGFGATASWLNLGKEYMTYRNSQRSRPMNYKQWLREEKGINVNNDSIAQVVSAMDVIPDEIAALLDSLSGVVSNPGI